MYSRASLCAARRVCTSVNSGCLYTRDAKFFAVMVKPLDSPYARNACKASSLLALSRSFHHALELDCFGETFVTVRRTTRFSEASDVVGVRSVGTDAMRTFSAIFLAEATASAKISWSAQNAATSAWRRCYFLARTAEQTQN